MFAQRDFVACIEQQLVERGFGAERKAVIVDNFNGLREGFEAQGYGSQVAGSMAMNAVFERLALITRERSKRAAKTLEVQAETGARVEQGTAFTSSSWLGDGGKGHGASLVRAAISAISYDPRAPGFRSAELVRDGLRNKYHALMGDGLDDFGKGAMGSQRNSANVDSIVDEIYGVSSGDAKAARFAKSYMALDDVMVIDRNNAGGSLQKLDTYFLPQRQNPVTVVNTPYEKWRDDHMNWLAWDKMRWPDGSPIKPAEREGILQDVYTTFSTDAMNKVDAAKFSGRGSAMGDALEDHRFLIFKDADSWRAMHNAYGDGNVVDTILRHIESMAHKTAAIDVFGPNPAMWLDNAKATIMEQAAALIKAGEKSAGAEASKVIKNRLEPMFKQYMHMNPMDPNSPLGAGVLATSNVLTSAKLAGTLLVAAPGDFQQTLAMRFLNHRSIVPNMEEYIKGMTFDFKGSQEKGTRSGFVFDSLVGATYTTERFTPIATYGPQWSRTLSDGVLRLSGLNRHTEIARASEQFDLMGYMHDNKGKGLDDLPTKAMFERYGIGAAEWDAVRNNIKPWSPEPGVEFMRPLDILDTKLANKEDLYQRFFSMVMQESKYAVPGMTLEANVTLRHGLRPDTMPGVLLHSFGMYRNFPMTVWQMYGRLAQSSVGADRLKFIAAMGVGMTLVGAVGTQLRELAKGRNPMPMDTVTFWGKAALAGGAMSIWGDFLFGGVNDLGRGFAEAAGGPLAGLATDAANVALGDPFKYAGLWDKDRTDDFKSTFASRGANFLRQNAPGTSLWYARLALEREIWDRLDELADPRIDQKRRARMRKQERTYGNTYYSAPGERLLGR